MNFVTILPPVTLLTALVTIATSCGLAISSKHIPPYPQISMCGMFPPERYVFSYGMTVVSTLFATLFLINHCRIERIESKSGSKPWVGSAGLHLGLGLSSCICLALMATVPVSELPVQHVLFAVGFFVLILIFQFWSCADRIRKLCASWASLGAGTRVSSASTEAFMLLSSILTLVGFITWQMSGSSVSQYLAVASVMLHFLPYCWELRDTSLIVAVDVKDPADLSASEPLLLDSAALSPLDRRGPRAAPVVVAVLSTLLLMLLLAWVSSHLGLNVEGRELQHDMRKPPATHPVLPGTAPSPAQGIYRYHGSRR